MISSLTESVCVQEESWPELLLQRSDWQCSLAYKVVHEVDSSDAYRSPAILDLLSRIEDLRFIHTLTAPLYCSSKSVPLKHAGAKPSNSYYLRYLLPRFNLLFELKPGSSCKLYSYNYSGYYVARQEALSQALKSVRPQLPHITQLPLLLQLKQFIVLVADDPSLPVKVLVPDAPPSLVKEMTISGDFRSAFFASRSDATSIDHHCYTFHPYTTQLDTPVME